MVILIPVKSKNGFIVTAVRIEKSDVERRYSVHPPKTNRQELLYFWFRVEVSKQLDACWEWKGPRFKTGLPYGKFKNTTAHRVAYSHCNGALAENLDVMHICDNPPCCNPNHLKAVPTIVNVHDCFQKRRRDLLSEDTLNRIHEMHRAGTQQKVIAQNIGISRASVCRIVHGKAYHWA
jgi:hypothetical protein